MSDAVTVVARIREALDEALRVLTDYTPGAVKSLRQGGGDPLTAADLAVDRLLREILPSPGEGWLSEETVDDGGRLAVSSVWVVDPIDGTREFVDGIPEWCVSIGYVLDGEPVAGGIVNPQTREVIVGHRDLGVDYTGPAEAVIEIDDLNAATILASRSEVRRGEWVRFADVGLDITPMGSIAYKLGLVAARRAHLTWTLSPKHEWDVAAGVALCLAAGLEVFSPSRARLSWNAPHPLLPGLIAGPSGLVDAAHDLISGP